MDPSSGRARQVGRAVNRHGVIQLMYKCVCLGGCYSRWVGECGYVFGWEFRGGSLVSKLRAQVGEDTHVPD